MDQKLFKKIAITTSVILGLISMSEAAFAVTGDISINSKDIRFSTDYFLEGNPVRIYATATNLSNRDLLGVVRFFDNSVQIGADQAISLFSQKTDDVFIDWSPIGAGSHRIAVKIYPWDAESDDPSNNWIVTDVSVLQDTDHDGTTNSEDPDDDNDGVNDPEDQFPLNSNEQYDTDGDSTGNTADTDDDNDGVPDEFDDMPLDPNETMDTDHDGIGNIADDDDDGDGYKDSEEENLKLDPLKNDTDDDTVNDKEDPFPTNPEEWADTDKDSLGNNTDTDDDNDGMLDKNDEFPLNKGPTIKLEDENTTVNLLEEVTFDATPSYDEDGQIVTYSWEIDGQEKEGNSVRYTFGKPGDHDVRLTITDNQGESRTTQFRVSVMNLSLYSQIIAIIVILLLAILIFFKYISGTKFWKHTKK